MLLNQLGDKVEELLATFEAISPERRKLLLGLSGYIRLKRQKKLPIQLVFICTHNSRRSQMAEAWARVAAYHFGLADIQVYSGGTEVTAFHPNAVRALRSAVVAIRFIVSQLPKEFPGMLILKFMMIQRCQTSHLLQS